jgi:hypothetical protein
MEFDVPWEVQFDKGFWDTAQRLKESGNWDNIEGTIRKIIEDPARVGRYKDGTLKGVRTTHIGEKVIGWQVKPGVNADMQDKVEEVGFLFIVHHDDMGVGFTQFNPVEGSSDFRVTLPYYGGFEMDGKIAEFYQVAKSSEGFRIRDVDWKPEEVIVEGVVPSDSREDLEEVIPDSADVDYDDPDLFE